MSDNKSDAASADTKRLPNASRPLRNLHVKRIPWAIWAKARHNALLSNVPFRNFIIALLDRSTPLPDTTLGESAGADQELSVEAEAPDRRHET